MEEKERSLEPIPIRNRDIPVLANVLYIMQDIKGIEKRRQWQRERMYTIKTQRLTGMPGSGSGTNGLESSFSLLAELESEHEKMCRYYTKQLKQAEKILNNIESHSMRTFVMMKYVMNISDTEIRKELNISRRGFDRARKCIEEAECMKVVKWQERYILIKN